VVSLYHIVRVDNGQRRYFACGVWMTAPDHADRYSEQSAQAVVNQLQHIRPEFKYSVDPVTR
jgi:hypothetical protein